MATSLKSLWADVHLCFVLSALSSYVKTKRKLVHVSSLALGFVLVCGATEAAGWQLLISSHGDAEGTEQGGHGFRIQWGRKDA